METINSDRIATICVYCASSSELSTTYINIARELGAIIGKKGFRLVTGAGLTGLMGAVVEGAMEFGAQTLGIIPQFMIDNGWHNQKMSKIIPVKDMHDRKKVMADISDGFIALPGGYGTMEEFLEIITWKQLGLISKPLVILNANEYYSSLLEQLSRAVDERFVKKEHHRVWMVAKTPQGAVDMLLSPNSQGDPISKPPIK